MPRIQTRTRSSFQNHRHAQIKAEQATPIVKLPKLKEESKLGFPHSRSSLDSQLFGEDEKEGGLGKPKKETKKIYLNIC